MPADEVIFHLTTPGEWDAARTTGQVVPAGFAAEGFVHCSTVTQLLGTIERHFADAEELCLLQLDGTSLADALRWEEGRPGEIYPHVYRPIRVAEVVRVVRWQRGEDGSVGLPPEIA
ncbi:MAG: DUF952 domain-containing protein [Acidimicrobiales bacterium]